MNPLDIGVIAVIALSAVFAFARGFVREALSIVAWVTAGFVTLYGFKAVYALIDPMVHNPLLSQLIAGFGLFIGTLIVMTILTGIVARSVRSSALSPIDRTLGFIFGLLRGAFVVSLAYLLLDVSLTPSDRPGWVREAKSTPYLQQGADMLRAILPESLKSKSAAAADEAIRTVTPAVDADRALRALTKPTAPAAPPQPADPTAPAYNPGERRELDRLIGTQH
ncbi:MAG TPA: CvpA family protein [Stellaceae bacterium]|jgi:membrane protein required for colicin V production|nr:CvpA family protein [Stellaceae bacterium]